MLVYHLYVKYLQRLEKGIIYLELEFQRLGTIMCAVNQIQYPLPVFLNAELPLQPLFLFVLLRRGLTWYFWLFWNFLCRSGWPQTQKDPSASCVLNTEIKIVCYSPSLFCIFNMESYSKTQTGLEFLTVFLPQPLDYRDF